LTVPTNRDIVAVTGALRRGFESRKAAIRLWARETREFVAKFDEERREAARAKRAGTK
jgi:hypothetical protein